MCDLITEYNFYQNDWSSDDKLNYVTNILGINAGKIYGKVVNDIGEYIFIKPYNIHGEETQIFLNQKCNWGVIAKKSNKDIKQGDFVKGKLFIQKGAYKGRLAINSVRKLQTQDEFKEELEELLRKKWQKDGFTFNKDDIGIYDKTVVFEEWVAKEVEAKLEEKYEDFIREKINKKEHQLKDIEDKINSKNDELDDIKSIYNQENQELKSVLKKKAEAEEKYQYYKELGIIKEDETDTNDTEASSNISSYEEAINRVWRYLWTTEKLHYEKTIIRSFMNALRTQQLILLWGRPGTGKTSLPKSVAKVIGAKCIVIQVQSNWTDNQDILGFYNPVDKRYVSTQFLDAIVEAKNHTNQLYIILLDEMNLSNIEYYFSEMLNVFTKNVDEKYKLYLYSEKYRTDAKKDLDNAASQKKDICEYRQRLQEMFNNYPPVLEIPDNIRFVGTLNTDETTKTISPKVIDRSYVIELQTMTKKTRELEEKNLSEQIIVDNEIVLSKSIFNIKTADIPEDNPIKIKISEINDIFEEENMPLPMSNRIYSYINQWLAYGDDATINEDDVILGKFLPTLDIPKNSVILEKIKEVIDKNKHKKSWQKLEMMEKAPNGRIMYWEN